MIRAFLDANVLLDLALRRPRISEPIKEAALDGRLFAFVSFGVLEEVRRALDIDHELRELRISRGVSSDHVLHEILTFTRFSGGFTFVRRMLRRDPSDEPVLSAALAGEADFLVTRNIKDPREVPAAIQVVTPEQLIEIFENMPESPDTGAKGRSPRWT